MPRILLFLFAIISIYACSGNKGLNKQGKELSPKDFIKKYGYDVVTPFSENIALARKGDKTIAIDRTGIKQFDWPYDAQSISFNDGFAEVKQNGLYGVIGLNGREVVPTIFDYVGDKFQNDFVRTTFKNQGGTYSLNENKFYPLKDLFYRAISPNKIITSTNFKYYRVVDLEENVIHGASDHWVTTCCGYYTIKQDGKVGVHHANGDLVVPYEYDQIFLDNDTNIGATKNGKQGRINLLGEVLFPFKYNRASRLGDLYKVKEEKSTGQFFGLADSNGELLTEIVYSNVRDIGGGYVALNKSKKISLLHIESKELIEVPYTEIKSFKNDLFKVKINEEAFAVDSNLLRVDFPVPAVLDSITTTAGNTYKTRSKGVLNSNGYIEIEDKNKLIGLVNANYEEILAPVAERSIKYYKDGFVVKQKYKTQLFNFQGEEVLLDSLNFNRQLDNGFIVSKVVKVYNYDRYLHGVYDFDKGIILNPEYQEIKTINNLFSPNIVLTTDTTGLRSFFDCNQPEKKYKNYKDLSSKDNRLFIVYADDKVGMVNLSEEQIIPMEYDELKFQSSTAIVAKKDNRYTVLNSRGEQVLLEWYENIEGYAGRLKITKDGQVGLFDDRALQVLPFEYQDFQLFAASDKILAKKNDKWGAVDKENNHFIAFQYDKIKVAKGPYYLVSQNDLQGLLDGEGQQLLPIEYDEIRNPDENLIWLKKEKWGLIDLEKNIILDYSFDKVGGWALGATQVWKNNKTGLVNLQGEYIIPLVLDKLKRSFGKNKTMKATIDGHQMKLSETGVCIENCLSESEMQAIGIKVK